MENEEQIKIESKGSNAKCEACGAGLVFDPNTQKLKCDSCGSTYDFSKKKGQVKHLIQETESNESLRSEWAKELKVVKCQTCGAEIVMSGLQTSSACPYCGSDYVMEHKSLPGLKPDVVVPFAFDEEECAKRFQAAIKKKFFAPRPFKKQLPANKIRGLYVPTFTFDADSYSVYKGELSKTETHRDSKGNTHTTRKYFKISGDKKLFHRDYVVETSTKMNGKQMNSLLPYNFDETYSFTNDFLYGFAAEHYEDTMKDCYSAAQSQMSAKIRQDILSGYHYDRVEWLDIDTDWSKELYSYRLLPVYTLEFEWKNKKYITFLNGQTGKLGIGYPTSMLKKVLVFGGIALVVIAIVVLLAIGQLNK